MEPAFLPDDAYRRRLLAVVRLALVPGVGARTYHLLVARFGSPDDVFQASAEDLAAVSGVGPRLIRGLREPPTAEEASAVLDECSGLGIDVIWDEHPRYPRLLREIPDPPPLLFVRGELKPEDELAIAIVGTRDASHYGLTMAERLAGGMARAGLTVVSGLARGIDAAAHRGALAAGGRTVAVLGSGVDNIYPPEHANLAEDILQQGALVSEFPPHAAPHGGRFPQRNRIISGMSVGTIVVEAGDKSGALITARHAMEQNREVFAVPGRADQLQARGCHRLLRDGAALAETSEDILEQLGPLVRPVKAGDAVVRKPLELTLNPIEQQILQALDDDPTPIDRLIDVTALSASQVLATLSVLEMRRLVRRVGGTMVQRL
ncbi:MAG: DNA-protecting protein DprA [Thermogutta sp.]|nr:DNA-protecting protein DprA [Thermogutta sp.]